MSSNSFYNERTIQKIRKARACYWCGETIRIGSRAITMAGQFEGDFWYGAMHPECHAALCRCEDASDSGYFAYDHERGMTLEESHRYRRYIDDCDGWLYERQQECGRHFLPVRVTLPRGLMLHG